MTETIEITGWDEDLGPALKITTKLQGWRNRREPTSVDEIGDHHGAEHGLPDYSELVSGYGIGFNRGYLYEVDAIIDGEAEHTLTVDASEGYVILGPVPGLEIIEVSVLEDEPGEESETSVGGEAAEGSAGDDEDAPEGAREVGAADEEE